jgi:hypothetical protein
MSTKDIVEEKDLIFFFETIVERLKKNVISEKEKADLSLFYIKNLYEKVIEDNENEDNENEDKKLDYLSLGWYIHEFLLKSNR